MLNSQKGNEPGRADQPAAVDPRIRLTASPAEVERLRKILMEAVSRNATDIHIRAGDVVYARVDGDLVPLDTSVLSALNTYEMTMHILATSANAPDIDAVHDHSGPWSAPRAAPAS